MPPIRDAASLLLLKQSESGLSILMGMRHANHKFLPNRMVFPGGAVDSLDFSMVPGSPLRPELHKKLLRNATPPMCDALGIACARELFEETGLSLGVPPDLSGLDYLCRAVTPEEHTIRFNARFFIADAACASGTLAGSGELESLDWYPLTSILQLQLAAA
ncbi:MAG: hypothetical protein B7Z81_14415, partial [Acidocella sp. 20-61-6]